MKSVEDLKKEIAAQEQELEMLRKDLEEISKPRPGTVGYLVRSHGSPDSPCPSNLRFYATLGNGKLGGFGLDGALKQDDVLGGNVCFYEAVGTLREFLEGKVTCSPAS